MSLITCAFSLLPLSANKKVTLDKNQIEQAKSILIKSGIHISDSDMDPDVVANKIIAAMIDEVNKQEKEQLKSPKSVLNYVKQWLGIGKSPPPNYHVSASNSVGSIKALFNVIKVISPVVAHYIILTVIFKFLGWLSGMTNR